MFDHIPTTRPHTPLLDRINHPADLRHLELSELEQLATELRQYLLFCVGQTGGHFGAGLGVVELTIALHYLYDTPNDRLIWDVGHQSYPHKILTGRRDQMLSMRQSGGLAGFPKRSESPFDTFGVGHSSTSISAALGMALGADMAGTPRRCVAVIGDGAMTAGMAFEGLNHAAHTGQDMLVVLNDNNMSISENVGGLNDYFSRIWASKLYTNLREGGKKVLSKLPPQALELAKKAEEHMKGMVSPATLFEELGFYYVGPIDGHDMERLVHDLGNLRDIEGPKLLHIITQKGKGFSPAEADPVGYHALNKIEPKPTVTSVSKAPEAQKYQDVFGDWLCDMAAADEHLIGITPAMCEGSGMVAFSQRFSDRYHDVAIAEQHAVTLAAGLACEDQKPVVAIYSTFLQRAYDQLIHDVAIQNLDVTFAIDRAGLVGEDGPTHAGSFDLSFLRCIPNMVIAAPADENECRLLLTTAYLHKGPAAVRYPRGKGPGASIEKALLPVEIGKGRKLRQGQRVALLNFGAQLGVALEAAEQLNATVIDMRFVKPLDTELLQQAVDTHELLITLEENSVAGGAGSAVSEWLAQEHILVPIAHIGLPDHFIDHGNHRQLVEQAGISKDNIVRTALQRLGKRSDELIANNQT